MNCAYLWDKGPLKHVRTPVTDLLVSLFQIFAWVCFSSSHYTNINTNNKNEYKNIAFEL